ncbi:MAG: NADH-quinone oxidoreductase subunit D [Bacteroidetes bacterium]|nr:NADH-quinone oxidoreductase subunit D [Bacteroidota bacterium]
MASTNKIDKIKKGNTSVTNAEAKVEEKEYSTLNLGPTHPATHGIFQNILKMDGEIIVEAESTVGYIHRAFEKIAEHRNYYQITTLTDRLNYCSSPINNMGWHMAVEKLFNIEVPKRAQYLRVIIMELSRIADHLICNSVIGVDTGALTVYFYIFSLRERIYEIFEEICGARLTTNIGRVGGIERDFSPKVWAILDVFMKELPAALKEFENLLVRNRIFMDRTIGCGPITAEKALQYSFTGPNLRAAGVDYDVRVMNPYSSYEEFDFIVPVGTNGDTYDRFMVREEEMWQSLSIIQQAIAKVKKEPAGIFHADVPDFFLPPKEDVYNNMEALIYHFKIVMGEIIYYQAYTEMIKGAFLSDAILTMSSMNVIAGELDA